MSVLDKSEHENYYIECKFKGKEYHVFMPVQIGLKPKIKRSNIRYYYKNYGIPVHNLSKIYSLSIRRIYEIVKDINPNAFNKCQIK